MYSSAEEHFGLSQVPKINLFARIVNAFNPLLRNFVKWSDTL